MSRIIPTPQQTHFGGGSLPLSSCRIVKGTVADSAEIREYFEKRLKPQERERFGGPCGEQAYFLAVEGGPSGRVICGATARQGLRYAEATLRQLRVPSQGEERVQEAEIVDWPDFQYRLNDWLIWSEIGCWSYDRGDGKEAFLRRAKDKLQWSADHKLNVILLDGMGWNAERFPGYGAMMRELNAYARGLGIHLMYSGYGSGYGMGRLYGGQIFENRVAYPRGERYACCGHPVRGRGQSRFMGTCISNDALMRLKQQELGRFVRSVHPGALYIHNLDIDDFTNLGLSWQQRCARCRERWPNDDPLAPDGAAGAYAHHYDSLTDAVFGVEDEEAGYRAARDCFLVHVSPAYGGYETPDEEWDRNLQYFAAVSRCMRNVANVCFGTREHLTRHRSSRRRLKQMAEVLHQQGQGHGICAILFHGCDGFFNDHLFSAAPTLSGFYQGATVLMNSSGTAYQEPLQLLNAEFAWNASQTTLPGGFAECKKRFEGYRDLKERPEGIFGAEGFLGHACEELYGERAGPHMREVFVLRTSEGLPPVAHITTKSFEAFGNPSAPPFHRWGDDLPEEEAARVAQRWLRVKEVTLKASAAAHAALDAGPPERTKADVQWEAKSFEIGALYAEGAQRYYELYAIAQRLLAGEPSVKASAIDGAHEAVLSVTRKIEELLRTSFPGRMLDYLGGDMGQKQRVLEYLVDKSLEIVQGSKTGVRGEKSGRTWW